MIRQTVVALAASLLLAGSPAAMGASAPQTSDHDKPLADKVSRAHRQLDESKQQTEKLRQQVDALQKRKQADQAALRQRDDTIAKLHEQLGQLDDGNGDDINSP